jgi:metallo-beta-lactamase class B
VPLIQKNVETLGFRLADIRVLLNSHAHYDHAGGLAELKRLTGGRLLASARDIPLLARGGRDDPQFGDRFPFPPVYADAIVKDGERIHLGGTEIVAHLTAGHTPGCTTWTTSVREGDRQLRVVFLCSMTVPSTYVLIGNKRYPDVVRDYREQFGFLKSLTPDIYLASHGSLFDLQEKMTAFRKQPTSNPFIDPRGYKRLIATMEERFEAVVEQQSKSGN